MLETVASKAAFQSVNLKLVEVDVPCRFFAFFKERFFSAPVILPKEVGFDFGAHLKDGGLIAAGFAAGSGDF